MEAMRAQPRFMAPLRECNNTLLRRELEACEAISHTFWSSSSQQQQQRQQPNGSSERRRRHATRKKLEAARRKRVFRAWGVDRL